MKVKLFVEYDIADKCWNVILDKNEGNQCVFVGKYPEQYIPHPYKLIEDINIAFEKMWH